MAVGINTAQPGDVNDYWVLWNPSSRYTEGALEPSGGFVTEPLMRLGNQMVPVARRFEFLDSVAAAQLAADTLPAAAVPGDSVSADPVPGDRVSAAAVPAAAVPADTIPVGAAPAGTPWIR